MRSLGALPGIPGEHAQGVLRDACDGRKRFRLRLASQTDRQPFLLRISLRHARRKNGRHVFDGSEPSRWSAQFAAATKSIVESEMAGRARLRRALIGELMARIT